MTENYRAGFEYLSAQYDEVNGCEFYRDIFPDNQDIWERNDGKWCPNAVYLYRDENNTNEKRRLSRRIMFADTWESDYVDYVEKNTMTLCSGLAYVGRANTLENARQMNALVFDLDGVGRFELESLFDRFGRSADIFFSLPMPTYLVLSGSGLHVYYVFDSPVMLYPNIKLQMQRLKYELASNLWIYGASSQLEKVQYQSINQGFRMVGSINESYGTEVKAFRVGERVTIEYINQYITNEKDRVDVSLAFKQSKMTRIEAAEKYQEWYQRVVVEGSKRKRKWNIAGQKGHNGDELYNWWLRQVDNKRLVGGHRYFFMMCMAIYASKCDIPRKRLKEDMQVAFEKLKKIKHTNELTQSDVDSAMEAYSKDYYNFTIAEIERLTDIRIERNKRNGRKQEQHVKIMNAVRDVIYPDGVWRNVAGRPLVRQQIEEYRQQYPEAKPKECIVATGLSKSVVYKWWDAVVTEGGG